jgi:prepilin-type processing-associated H-X9-DG protein
MAFYTTPWDRVAPSSPANAAARQAFWTNCTYPYVKNYNLDQTVGGVLWNLFGINDAQVNPMKYSDGVNYNAYLNTWQNSQTQQPADVVLTWPGLGNQNADGYGSVFPLPYFANGGWPSSGTATPYQFANTGANCVEYLGVWSGFSTWNYNVFGTGFNMSYCDGHAKFVQAGSSRSPWSQVNGQGQVVNVNYDSIDGPVNGCWYLAPMAPIRSSNASY